MTIINDPERIQAQTDIDQLRAPNHRKANAMSDKPEVFHFLKHPREGGYDVDKIPGGIHSGEYVKLADYEALAARLSAAERERDELRAQTSNTLTMAEVDNRLSAIRDERNGLRARVDELHEREQARKIELDVVNGMLAFATQQHEKQENDLVSYQLELAQVRDALERQHAATDQIWNQYHALTAQLDAALAQVAELQAQEMQLKLTIIRREAELKTSREQHDEVFMLEEKFRLENDALRSQLASLTARCDELQAHNTIDLGDGNRPDADAINNLIKIARKVAAHEKVYPDEMEENEDEFILCPDEDDKHKITLGMLRRLQAALAMVAPEKRATLAAAPGAGGETGEVR